MTESLELQCLKCAGKHCGTAWALLQEVETDRYPENIFAAIGELVCATNHTRYKYPDLCEIIESERLRLSEEPGYIPNLRLIFKLIVSIQEKEAAGIVVEIPKENIPILLKG